MFISKQEVHNNPDRERLRQFCPRHDPRCLGVDLSDPYNPKAVWDYDQPSKQVKDNPQFAAKRAVDLSLLQVVPVVEPEPEPEPVRKLHPDYSKLSWPQLKALCKRKGIAVAKTSRADLEAQLGAL